MSIPDALLPNWASLVTRWPDDEITAFVTDVEADHLHPKFAKQRLAREITARWHSEEAADAAEERWEREVGAGEGVTEAEELSLSVPLAGMGLLDLLVAAANGAVTERGPTARHPGWRAGRRGAAGRRGPPLRGG